MAIWKRISKYDKDIKKDEEYAKEVEEKMKETEKGDIPSMLLSAFLVLWLPCVVILILICVGAYVLLGLPFAGQFRWSYNRNGFIRQPEKQAGGFFVILVCDLEEYVIIEESSDKRENKYGII